MAALSLATVAVARGTWAVGGSDSSCYALTAEAFARGGIQPLMPLAESAPWPDATLTFTPAGFVPSPVRARAASPVCAPGFALLMAPFRWLAGRDGIFFVTPLAAALLVLAAFVVGRELAGPLAGALGTVLVATSPIVLFQAVQPMNDIATAALWMAVLAAATLTPSRRAWVMGVLTGLALLVRPNLAPVAIAVAVFIGWSSDRPRQALLRWGLGAAPAVALVALLNWMLYGHPLRLGYGNAADLFSVQHIGTNIAHHGRALLETQTPFPLLALAAPFVLRENRPLVWLALGIAAATTAVYLPYRPFSEWWYLRFLLPALMVAIVLASAALVAIVRRPLVVALAGVLLAGFSVNVARDRQVLDVQKIEARFRDTGTLVRDRLPPNALFITVWQSGTVRFHADREAVLWDSLDPASMDNAISWLRQRGYDPYLLLERWEEPAFRERFSHASPLGTLDWPPRFEIDRLVRIYAPADRDRYLAGQPFPTEHVIGRIDR